VYTAQALVYPDPRVGGCVLLCAQRTLRAHQNYLYGRSVQRAIALPLYPLAISKSTQKTATALVVSPSTTWTGSTEVYVYWDTIWNTYLFSFQPPA
jgi:hypothetical protein